MVTQTLLPNADGPNTGRLYDNYANQGVLLSGKVLTLHDHEDRERTLVQMRLWSPSVDGRHNMWSHFMVETGTHAIVGTGHASKEGLAWKRLATQMIAQGWPIPDPR